MCVIDSRVNNVDVTFGLQLDLVDLCEWELSLGNSFELPLHVISSSFGRKVLGWRVINGDSLVFFNGLNAVFELREVVLAECKSYFMLLLVDNHDTCILQIFLIFAKDTKSVVLSKFLAVFAFKGDQGNRLSCSICFFMAMS